MRTFDEIHEKVQATGINHPLYLLFLPSVHFWTVAIGKDAPLFFAVALCTWSVLNFSKRLIPFLFSMGVMVLFRAHIALVTGVSLGLASLLHNRFTVGRRALILVVSIAGAAVLLLAVRDSLHVDLTDPASISTFWEHQSYVAKVDQGNTSILNSSYPVKLLSLLFRPFFFDAQGGLGLVASLENVGSVLLFIYLLQHAKQVIFLSKRVLFVNFIAIFSVTLILLLAFLSYNVGLGLRQRAMVFSPLFCLFAALRAWDLARARSEQGQRLLARGRGRPASGEADRLPAT